MPDIGRAGSRLLKFCLTFFVAALLVVPAAMAADDPAPPAQADQTTSTTTTTEETNPQPSGDCENRSDCHQKWTICKNFVPHNAEATVDFFVKNENTGYEQHAGLVHDGQCVSFPVDSGPHSVREQGTDLSTYSSKSSCGGSVTIEFEQDASCTFTNTKKEESSQQSLTILKDFVMVPAHPGCTAKITVDGTQTATLGDGESHTFSVGIGSHTASEEVSDPACAANQPVLWFCDAERNGQGSSFTVVIGKDESLSCRFINRRIVTSTVGGGCVPGFGHDGQVTPDPNDNCVEPVSAQTSPTTNPGPVVNPPGPVVNPPTPVVNPPVKKPPKHKPKKKKVKPRETTSVKGGQSSGWLFIQSNL